MSVAAIPSLPAVMRLGRPAINARPHSAVRGRAFAIKSVYAAATTGDNQCCSSETCKALPGPMPAKAKCMHPQRPISSACADCPRKGARAASPGPMPAKAKCVHPQRPLSSACADCPRKGKRAASPGPMPAKAKCVHPQRPLSAACADCPRKGGRSASPAPVMAKAKCVHPQRPASSACADCPRKGGRAASPGPSPAKAKCVHPQRPLSSACADCPRKGGRAASPVPAMAKAKCVHPQRPVSQACADCPRRSSRTAADIAAPPAAAAAGAAATLRRLGRPLAAVGIAGLALTLLPSAAVAAEAAAAASSSGLVGMAQAALSFILHLDVHLADIVARHGTMTYAILFAIVFAETGLVVTPFLPGDSLLFATGALAALGKLSLPALLGVYITAATIGDAVNYAIGSSFGSRAVSSKLVSPEHVAKTEKFYAKYGGKAVVLARFVPIVRTFAPFIAGVGSMQYSQFALYNVLGAILWTVVCTGAGLVFGNIPSVQHNFSLVVLGIVAVSLLPLAWEMYAAKREAEQEAAAAAAAALAASQADGAQ